MYFNRWDFEDSALQHWIASTNSAVNFTTTPSQTYHIVWKNGRLSASSRKVVFDNCEFTNAVSQIGSVEAAGFLFWDCDFDSVDFSEVTFVTDRGPSPSPVAGMELSNVTFRNCGWCQGDCGCEGHDYAHGGRF